MLPFVSETINCRERAMNFWLLRQLNNNNKKDLFTSLYQKKTILESTIMFKLTIEFSATEQNLVAFSQY